MHRLASAATLVLACAVQSACADTAPSGPDQQVRADRGLHAEADRVVKMRDQCDPATFNAVLGPDACVRDKNGGRVTLAEFNAELAKFHEVHAWRFTPPKTSAQSGDVILAVNRGGEEHTFTRVAQFGGGFVTSLNVASGNPAEPVPECQLASLDPDDLVPPGGTYKVTVGAPGTELFQCCIHPWMRTVVRVHQH